MFEIKARAIRFPSTINGITLMGKRAGDTANLHLLAGRYMKNTVVPRIFAQNGPGWPAVFRDGAYASKILDDTGRMRKSIKYEYDARSVTIGTDVRSPRNQGRYPLTQNAGLRIQAKKAFASLPGGPYMTIPLAPPLSPSERRNKRLKDFKNTFITRNKRGQFTVFQRVGNGIRAIFLLRRTVKIPVRSFLEWTQATLAEVSDVIAKQVIK